MRVVTPLVLVVAVLMMTGCIAVGGRHSTNPPTLGQQLIDLQDAYQKGAITEHEYRHAKAEMLGQTSEIDDDD